MGNQTLSECRWNIDHRSLSDFYKTNKNYKKGKELVDITSRTLALGGTVVNAVIAGKSAYQNKRLRAYYAH